MKNILFVTADLTVHTGEMYAAGKSGGCGYPVATQWRVRNDRLATATEIAEHQELVTALVAEVEARRYWWVSPWDASRAEWTIRADVLVHARLAWIATGQRQWGRTHDEFRYQQEAA